MMARPRAASPFSTPSTRRILLSLSVAADSQQELDQRAFARAVLAADRADLAGAERERDVAQRGEAAEAFAEAVDGEDVCHVSPQSQGGQSGPLGPRAHGRPSLKHRS